MATYQEQLDRARRFYQKFKDLNDGMVYDEPLACYLDDVHAFFQNCYHVKDHLKNDSTFTQHTGKEIEDYVTNTAALAICADICNGMKHLTLKKLRSGAEPKLGKHHVTMEINETCNVSSSEATEKPIKIRMRIEVQHNGVTLDAFQIATDALNAWDTFVK